MELDAPAISLLEEREVLNALRSGFVSSVGPLITEFETKMAQYLGAKACVAVQSGTAALHLALKALGIGQGDEVVVPALTFIATVNAVLYVGATPVIADVAPETWCLDPNCVEHVITSKTRAIIPVHLFGVPCDLDALQRISKKYDLYLIEDATEALGATHRGKMVGTIGDLGCYSFNGNKMITTGSGGMVVSNDEDRIEYIRHIANQAKLPGPDYIHDEMGFNYRMTNIGAALGLAQLTRLDEFITKKETFRQTYKDILGDLACFQEHSGPSSPVWWMTAIRLVTGKKDIGYIQNEMSQRGIPTRRVFFPLDRQKYLKNYAPFPCTTAKKIHEKGLCLPSSVLNSKEEVITAARVLRDLLRD